MATPEQRREREVATGATSAPAKAPGGVGLAGVLATAVAAVLRALRRFMDRRSSDLAPMADELLRKAAPQMSDDERSEVVQRELGFEADFSAAAYERVRERLTGIVQIADKAERREKVTSTLTREQRIARDRERAMVGRLVAAARNAKLREVSPEGAYWKLGEDVKEHTIDAVAPWCVVDGPVAHAAGRRWFDGELVEIETESGARTSVTPKHPVLTTEGWVAAGLLDERCYLVRQLDARGDTAGADVEDVPATAEQVFGALAHVPELHRVVVPIGPEDFHGDGQDGYVEVVGSDRPLGGWSQWAKGVDEGLLPGGSDGLVHLLRQGGAAAGGVAVVAVIAGASHHRPGSPQTVGHGGARYAEAHAHSEGGLASLVGRQHFVGCGYDGEATDGHPSPPQGRDDDVPTDPQLARQLLGGLAGRVAPDKIIEVRRVPYSGHVYDLGTAEKWYTADSLVVHNCLAMANRAWPWFVLRKLSPGMMHYGCCCSLYSIEHAKAKGWLPASYRMNEQRMIDTALLLAKKIAPIRDKLMETLMTEMLDDEHGLEEVKRGRGDFYRHRIGTATGGEFAKRGSFGLPSLGDLLKDTRKQKVGGKVYAVPVNADWVKSVGGKQYVSPAGTGDVFAQDAIVSEPRAFEQKAQTPRGLAGHALALAPRLGAKVKRAVVDTHNLVPGRTAEVHGDTLIIGRDVRAGASGLSTVAVELARSVDGPQQRRTPESAVLADAVDAHVGRAAAIYAHEAAGGNGGKVPRTHLVATGRFGALAADLDVDPSTLARTLKPMDADERLDYLADALARAEGSDVEDAWDAVHEALRSGPTGTPGTLFDASVGGQPAQVIGRGPTVAKTAAGLVVTDTPPEPLPEQDLTSGITGIPDYDGTPLTLGKGAGGSNGARWAFDAEGRRWLLKGYRGNRDRVATEALANAVYREVGAPAAVAGTVQVEIEPDFATIPDVPLNEPPMKLTGPGGKKRRASSGMLVVEPNGDVWIFEPRDHFCVPLDSEILTRTGWKRHDEVVPGDETLGLNPETGLNEWTAVQAVHHFDDAPMVRYGNEKWSVRCTPNHRWLVAGVSAGDRAVRRRNDEIREMLAGGARQVDVAVAVGCAQSHVSRVLRGASGVRKRHGHDEHPLINGFAMVEARTGVAMNRQLVLAAPDAEGDCRACPDDAALIGWLVTDGHVRRAGRSWHATIAQTKPEGRAAIEALLEGYAHSVSPRRYYLHVGAFRGLMERTGWDGTKGSLPAMVLSMGQDALRAFMDAAWMAEGDVAAGRDRLRQNTGPVLDACALAAYRLGKAPSVYLHSGKCQVLSMRPPTLGSRKVHAVADGSAPAWCVTTGLGTWTMRQGGRVALTGNSGYERSFPKGGIEQGLTAQQNAHKELWEETGLHAKVTGLLGDYDGDTSVSRYYVAVRTGGTPTLGPETQGVERVSPEKAAELLNRQRDKTILADMLAKAPPEFPEGGYPDEFPAQRGPALAYPTVDGEVRQSVFRKGGPSEALGEHFMADALLGNWDFVGLADDNVLWTADDTPVRIDQGGTFEYRAQGQNKPFGPVPTEVWTMLEVGQGKHSVKVTPEGMKEQAADLVERLPPDRVDALIDSAPFGDLAMRERVRTNLKARLEWMGRFSRGEETLPPPLREKAAWKELEAHGSFELSDAEKASLTALGDPATRTALGAALKSKEPLPADAVAAVAAIDAVVADGSLPDDAEVFMGLTSGPESLVGQTLRLADYLYVNADPAAVKDNAAVLRLRVPAGVPILGARALIGKGPQAMMRRGQKFQVTGRTQENGRDVLDAVAVPDPDEVE